jgi:hypothetical protein
MKRPWNGYAGMGPAEKSAWNRRVRDIAAVAPYFIKAAKEAGLVLRTSLARTGKTDVPHWHFHVGGKAVFHWWPSNGKWWCPTTQERGVESRPNAILRLAITQGMGGTQEKVWEVAGWLKFPYWGA